MDRIFISDQDFFVNKCGIGYVVNRKFVGSEMMTCRLLALGAMLSVSAGCMKSAGAISQVPGSSSKA